MMPSGSSISRAIGVASVTAAADLLVTVAPMTPRPIIITRSGLPVLVHQPAQRQDPAAAAEVEDLHRVR